MVTPSSYLNMQNCYPITAVGVYFKSWMAWPWSVWKRGSKTG